jgi:hypothetical protein
MSRVSKYIMIVIACFALNACETEIDKTISFGGRQVVVDCILTTELSYQELRLSQSGLPAEPHIPIRNASVFVLDDQGKSIEFFESSEEDGLYFSQVPFASSAESTYTLQLVVVDSLYTAQSSVAEVIQSIPEPQYQEIDSVTRRLADFIPFYDQNEQAMYRMDLDWSQIMPDTINMARVYFYTFDDLDIGSLLPGELEFVDFPVGTILSITKYGLTDEFAEFLRAAVIESRWNGGIYFNASGEIPSNIEPNGLGFFTSCATFTQTFSVQ